MLSLKTVEVPLNENYKIDTTMLEDCITDNTMAITAIAGSTEFGLVDDIKEISKIAKSNDVYLHVDAALGGFIIPFLNYRNDNQLNFDFKCKGVSSITIDPHKMGLAPVPAGGILFRHKKYLDKLAIDAPYLTKNVQTTIVGTRTGASTAATWALINYQGMDGYADVVEQSINLTQYTYNKLMQMDDVNVIVKPELNVVAFNVSDMKVNKLKEELLKKGWRVSNTVNPYAIRLVLMPHVKKEHIDNFLVDLREIIKEN
jgi:tyrosine decarboxylase/aspartate 1-decarboxylase